MLRCIGLRENDIFDSFRYPTGKSKDKYKDVIEQFDNFCKPRKNDLIMRHQLRSLKQGNQTIDEFITQLHKIARDCELADMYEGLVLQALLLGKTDDKLRRRLFERTEMLTLDDAIKLCRANEATTADLKALKPEQEVVKWRNRKRVNITANTTNIQ